MKIIKHLDLAIEPEQKIPLPYQAKILGVSVVNNKPFLRVMVDTAYDRYIDTTFFIVSKDKEVPQHINETHHAGSFEYQEDVGSHVLDVFEQR